MTLLASYVVKLVRAGHRLTGSCTVDVMSEAPLTRERVGQVHSLADPGPGEDGDLLYEILADRRWRWPMVEYVGAHLDWEAFVQGCSKRGQRIFAMMLEGRRRRAIASALGSPHWLSASGFAPSGPAGTPKP